MFKFDQDKELIHNIFDKSEIILVKKKKSILIKVYFSLI